MQGFKEFYEEVTKNEELKNMLEEAVEKRMDEARKLIINDQIAIAKKHNYSISEKDFTDSVKKGVDGVGGGCLLIDSGCFVCGEINDHGGCIVIGVR